MTSILTINASVNRANSKSNSLLNTFLAEFEKTALITKNQDRDVAEGLPLLTAEWTAANFTPEEDRTNDQRRTLALSDSLINEVSNSDLLLFALPIYNFGVPASLKAWIDLVARARKTFVYTENGPKGLLTGKKAIIFAASGGTEVGSAIDFAVPYLKHALSFIGIQDVEVIAADALMSDQTKFDAAQEKAKALGDKLGRLYSSQQQAFAS